MERVHVTASAPCGCDEAKEWKARAHRAEISLKFARQQLIRLLEKVEQAIFEQEKSDPIDLGVVVAGSDVSFGELSKEGTTLTGGDSSSISAAPGSEADKRVTP